MDLQDLGVHDRINPTRAERGDKRPHQACVLDVSRARSSGPGPGPLSSMPTLRSASIATSR